MGGLCSDVKIPDEIPGSGAIWIAERQYPRTGHTASNHGLASLL